MAKKSSSGVPYAMPSGRPSYVFEKCGINIKIFYNTLRQIEVYQTSNNHTQRMVMTPNDYENFENRLKSNGFKQLAFV